MLYGAYDGNNSIFRPFWQLTGHNKTFFQTKGVILLRIWIDIFIKLLVNQEKFLETVDNLELEIYEFFSGLNRLDLNIFFKKTRAKVRILLVIIFEIKYS